SRAGATRTAGASSAPEGGRRAHELLGDHLQVLDAGARSARQAVDGEADPVEAQGVSPLDRRAAVRRRAVDRPVVQALVEAELELDHALLLHLPRSVHVERALEIGARRGVRRLLPRADAQAA